MNLISGNQPTQQTTNLTHNNTNIQIIYYPKSTAENKSNSSNKNAEFINRFRELVEKYYQDDRFRVKKLAQLMGMSEQQFSRRLKSLTNQGFAAYLKFYRLMKAKELLENYQDLNISEIAYEVGFTDPNYFSRAFSKVFGQPPSSLRTIH